MISIKKKQKWKAVLIFVSALVSVYIFFCKRYIAGDSKIGEVSL